jgi:HSP20 family protein
VSSTRFRVSGEKSEERTEGDEERNYHLWERSYGSFRRSFSLPRAVSADQATARFDKGVLEIRLPKAPEAKGRKIEISKS